MTYKFINDKKFKMTINYYNYINLKIIIDKNKLFKCILYAFCSSVDSLKDAVFIVICLSSKSISESKHVVWFEVRQGTCK